MITLLGPILLLGLYVVLVACLAPRHRGPALWGRATVMAATVRVGVLWGLLALHWRQALGLWAMPLLLLLLPEGLVLPRDFSWTLTRAGLATGLLAVGTALWSAMALAVFRLLRRTRRFKGVVPVFVLALALIVASPLAAGAQPASRVYRIGHLSSLDALTANYGTFREKLQDLGWVEGKNIRIENRLAGRNLERLTAFAADLVHLPVDLILVTGVAESARAAKNATRTIPIVFVLADDPVGAGLISSLSRPEANVTGLSSMNVELDAKRLALLKEALPRLKQVGVLWSPVDPSGSAVVRATETAARSLGVQLQLLRVRGPQDLNDVFGTAQKQGAEAVTVLGSPTLFEYQRRIAELGMKARLPVISAWRQLPESGGLMSYGADLPEMFRRAAIFVDKILKGAKPGDLPVEQPTKFELVINAKTAKALGLTIPPSVLARADEIIE